MKLSLAVFVTSCAAAVDAGGLGRRLSFEKVAGYKPDSQVTDHCAIDLDQKAIEAQLAIGTNEAFGAARKIYNTGGNSKVYAQVTITPALTKAIAKGDSIMGRGTEDQEVAGKTGQAYEAGDSNIKVYYSTTDIQSAYVGCQVGGLVEPTLKGCFKETGEFTIGGDTYTYTYDPATENKAGRTISGFSTGAESKMLTDCPGCPYEDFSYFNDYYGTPTYAHKWVEAAFDGKKTEFKNGNADFSLYGTSGREQVIKKGTAYLNIFMYVIREFEDALDDCKRGLLSDNYNSVHAWDEGVCFYTGSIEGQDGITDDGKLLHQLADKRCGDYKTCGPDGVDAAGQAKLNYDLFDLFAVGNYQIQNGNCPGARRTTAKITDLMYVPMIQGTMRYAYKVDKLSGGEKEKAEGAVFAAAVLPRVHAANPEAAKTIYNNLRVGAPSTDFKAVKAAFESVYEAMGISCADIGGLWSEASKDYYPGMEPCRAVVSSKSTEVVTESNKTLAIALGCTFGALFAIAAAMVLYMRGREKEGKPVFQASQAQEEGVKDMN